VANANAAINAALKDKKRASIRWRSWVWRPMGSTPAEMDKSQKEEHTRWGPLVKKIGFTAES
jgi:tripartite-type tricarboxylate transporter receptor subunit TctC